MALDEDLEAASVATVEFERDLQALVLEAFARGAAVEGTWDVTPRPGAVPDWTIEITKRAVDDESAEDRPMLD